MMNSMATHRYSPYSLPTHTAAASSLQPTSYTSSSLLPSTQGISNNIQVCNISTSDFFKRSNVLKHPSFCSLHLRYLSFPWTGPQLRCPLGCPMDCPMDCPTDYPMGCPTNYPTTHSRVSTALSPTPSSLFTLAPLQEIVFQ